MRRFGACARRVSSLSAVQPKLSPPPSVAAALEQPFSYRLALVRGLSPDFAASALRGVAVPIDQVRAASQHAAYVAALRGLVPHVIELPPADGSPDSCFVEDTVVALGGTVLLASSGAASRRGEPAAVGAALLGLGYDVRVAPAGANVDGGDVLFTGAELFVGLSSRTNAAGAAALQACFPAVPVTVVPLSAAARGEHGRARRLALSRERQALLARAGVGGPALHRAPRPLASAAGALHLKSLLSMVSPGVVAVADTPAGHAAAAAMQASSKRGDARFHTPLAFLLVPDAPAANAVYANGKLLARADCPHSVQVLRDMLAVEAGVGLATDSAGAGNGADAGADDLVLVDTSELALADGALTCCSVLLH